MCREGNRTKRCLNDWFGVTKTDHKSGFMFPYSFSTKEGSS